MNEKQSALWAAVRDHAEVWRQSPVVRGYTEPIRAARRGGGPKPPPQEFVEHLLAGYGMFASQPLLFALLGEGIPEFVPLNTNDVGRSWIEAGRRVAEAFVTTIGWARTRLPGFPRFHVPQLVDNSALTTDEVTLHVPWRKYDRNRGLQFLPAPPDLDKLLGLTGSGIGDSARAVAARLAESDEAIELREARGHLTDADFVALDEAIVMMATRLSPEKLDAIEKERALPRLQYREAQLELASQGLDGNALQYVDAFTAADALTQEIGAVLSQLVIFGDFIEIGGIEDLQVTPTLRGSTVEATTSDPSAALFVHPGTICRIDHPLLSDAIHIVGTRMNFAIAIQTTLRGRIIPGC